MSKFLVETFTLNVQGQTKSFSKSQEIPDGLDTLIGLASALGLTESVTGTYSATIQDQGVTAPPAEVK